MEKYYYKKLIKRIFICCAVGLSIWAFQQASLVVRAMAESEEGRVGMQSATPIDDYYGPNDYNLVIDNPEPVPAPQYKITINMRYSDGAMADQTIEYDAFAGTRFEQPLNILGGYGLEQITIFSSPKYNLDANVLTIESVDEDYYINLTFSKIDHRIKITTNYLDNSQQSKVEYDWVEYDNGYSKQIQIEEGYSVINQDQLPQGVSYNKERNTLTITSVRMDYEILLEIEKTYEVTLYISYSDGSSKELKYQAIRGRQFSETIDVTEGFDLEQIMVMSMPEYDIDNNTISIDSVERDYSIRLYYSKILYSVKVGVNYLDGSQPNTLERNWVEHQDGFSYVISVPKGYKVANKDQLPEDVIYDEASQTLTIISVAKDYNIVIELDKALIDIIIKISYEDGLVADQIITEQVEYGSYYQTVLVLEDGYQINKIGLVPGVTVNKKQKTVSINSVTSPITVEISAR